MHKILLNSVLLSPIVSGGVRPKLLGQTPKGGATVLKVGGGQFCEQSEQQIFF